MSLPKYDSAQKEKKICSFCSRETYNYTEGLTTKIVVCSYCKDELFPKKETKKWPKHTGGRQERKRARPKGSLAR